MAELGTYYITIMPEMSKFTGAVNTALGDSGKQSGKSFGSKFTAVLKGSAIGTALGNLAMKAGGYIMDGIDVGIRRLDTLKNYPRVLESLGYGADEAAKSIDTITEHLDGLPSSTQDLVALTQSIADSTGDLDLATNAALGFNDMLLAAGASTQDAATAQAVLNRILGKGSATAAQWSSLTAVMPAQLGMVADKMLGTGSTAEDLHAALENGTVSWNDFLGAIAELDQSGYIDENGKSIASFTEQAKANSVGIGTAIQNVKNRIGAGWAKIFDVAGQENISGAIDKMSYGVRSGMYGIADGLQYVKDKIGQTKIGDSLGKIGKGIGDSFGGAVSKVTDKLKPLTDGLVNLIDSGLTWFVSNGDTFSHVGDIIGSAFDIICTSFEKLTPVAQFLWNEVLQPLASFAWDAISQGVEMLSGAMGELSDYLGTADFSDFVANLQLVKDGVVNFAKGFAKGVKDTFANVKKSIADNKQKWQDFKTNVTKWNEETRQKVIQKWQAIKTGVTNYTQQAKQSLSKNWQEGKKKVVEFNEQARTAILQKWDAIKTGISTKVTAIKTSLSTAWTNIKNAATKTWDNIKTTASTKWDSIKTTVTTKVNAIKTTASQAWDNMKTAASSKFDGIKTTISNKMGDAKNAVSNKLSEMRTAITGFAPKFKAIAAPVIGSISGKLSEMRSAITGFAPKFNSIAAPVIGSISGALQTIRDAVTNFKPSFPQISWPLPSMPRIPLPHFSVSHTSVLGGVLKIPKVSFDGWWAKGGVFDSASIIGIGEAGREAALPLNRKTYGEIARGIAREGDTGGTVTITGNTFYVRDERDIDRIAERLAQKIQRERWAMA